MENETAKKRGLLALPLFNSAIKSQNVKRKESIFGYFLGPFGVLVLNAMLLTWLNVYFTDVLNMTGAAYGAFLIIFPMISAAVVFVMSIVMGIVIDKTKTKQGKARPYILLSAPLLLVSGILMFVLPSTTESVIVKMVWIVISYNLYFSIANTMYMLSHSLMVPLSTRNLNQRGQLSVLTNFANIGSVGLFASIIFPVIYSFIGTSVSGWIGIMCVISGVACAAAILEYYFTRERITEESVKLQLKEEKVPAKRQLKAVLTDKYWWIIIIFFFIYQFTGNMKNGSMAYFCNYIVGTYSDGLTQTLLATLGGLPMAIGVVAAWPLAKKFGKKNITVFGIAINIIGGIICMIAPASLPMIITGLILKGIGVIPACYVVMALFADVLDHMEWKNKFRCDGLSMSLYSTIMVALTGISIGVTNIMLTSAGYINPDSTAQVVSSIQKINEGYVIYNQPAASQSVINFCYIGFELVGYAVMGALLLFLRVEKKLPKEQAEILERQKQAVLASGGEWIEPALRAKLEQDEQDRIANEARKAELMSKCEKKKLSFEEEEAKYQAALKEKQQKKEAKEARKKKKP